VDDLELGYLLAVAGAAVYSPRALHAWLSRFGSPRALVAHLRDALARAPDDLEELSDETRARLALIDDDAARAALDAAHSSGARVVVRSDEEYPATLADLCDPPSALYARGRLDCLARRCVAIVGSRAATAYGRSVAAAMAAEFAAFGVTVVSGLARGIDAAAHRGAVDAGVPTVAVLGSGMRALYPPYHALLVDEIVARGGAVLSEFPPDQSARAFQFPLRNRIVAALAHATVVVEASTRSGALITARLADELGRSVFAIPGDVGRPTSQGTNALIADGVPLVISAADVAAMMRWEYAFSQPQEAGTALPAGTTFEDGRPQEAGTTSGDIGRRLVAMLSQERTVDELAASTGAGASEIAAQLMLLELQGVVERSPGGAYLAVRTSTAANARPRT